MICPAGKSARVLPQAALPASPSGAKCPAPKIRFRAPYQRDLGRPVRARKIFSLCRRANQIQNSRRPASARGAYALSSRNVRRDAMDAGDVENDE
jgi:hypothetical protein